MHEVHRAARIRSIYTPLGIDTRFPLIEQGIDSNGARTKIAEIGIRRPMLYNLGFEHNNCSGGCVRQGAKQWRHLLRVLPEIYMEREELEREFFPHTFLKDISLSELRRIEESQGTFDFVDDDWNGECIGMCGTMM